MLHSLDEDDRSPPTSPIAERIKEAAKNNGTQYQQHLTPNRSVTLATNPLPASASPNTNSTFLTQHPGGPNGQLRNSPVKVT